MMADKIETIAITKLELDASQAIEESKKLEDQQDKTIESTEELTDATEDYSGALDSMLDSMGVLPASMTKGLKGVTGLTKGFKGLKLAIAATGIGALILLLGALFTWFNRTSEGQEKLRIGMAYLGQIVDSLLDTFADLGETIFNAFSDPKQAVTDLWNFIKTNLINRVKAIPLFFKAIGNSIEAAFKRDWDGLEDSIKDVGQAVIQFNTGLDADQQEKALDMIKGKWDEIGSAVQEAGNLQARLNQLKNDQIAFLTREADLQAQISEARLNANDASKTELEQLEASKNALDLTKTLYVERIALQQESVDILKEQQALGHNTIEDNEEMARQETALILLLKQRDDQLRSINTKYVTNLKAVEKLREEETNLAFHLKDLNQEKIEDNKAMLDQIQSDNFAALQKRTADEQAAADATTRIQQETAAANYEMAKTGAEDISHLLHMFNTENKELATTQVLISAIVAVMKGYEKGLIFGTANAIAVGLLSGKAIQDIHKAERGGMIGGKSHAQGGTLIEAERGEGIINKRSMANPSLRALASQINQWGGGIPFAQDGMLVGSSISGSINSMSRDLQRIMENAPPVLVLEDFHGANNRVMVKTEISTF